MIKNQEMICERNLFAAYVDGELDTDLTLLFEDHLDDCSECRAELRAHRLFVCELDAAMMGIANVIAVAIAAASRDCEVAHGFEFDGENFTPSGLFLTRLRTNRQGANVAPQADR